MPKANWGIDAADVDEFDRDSIYKPYSGPVPPPGVYLWQIQKLQSVKGTREKHPQLRVGLELVPREDHDEDKYSGYYKMAFLPVTNSTNFRYVPFLDAIGVSGREFKSGTITDEEGNIKKIGKWRNTGEEYVMAQLKTTTDQNGDPALEIGWFGAADFEEDPDDDDEEEYADDDE